METEIVGREEELARIDAFLDENGPRALLLEGEAGIGKTTLWRAGVERASARGHCVLAATPARAESEMAFAALGDLLAGTDRVILDILPTPQRRALEAALYLREAKRPPAGSALGLGLVAVLRELASSGKVTVAIDDTQWLDASSSAVLTFAARRLGDLDVAVLVARRTGEGENSVPLGLDTGLPEAAVSVNALGRLSLGALARVVRDRLGLDLRRPALIRLDALSGGNPLFAIELAPTLADAQPERLPTSLSAAAAARLAGLDTATRDALLVAAVSPSPTLGLIEQATGATDAWTHLEPASRAGVVVVDDRGDVRFEHPLYAAAVMEQASPKRRAEIHGRLAGLATTPELRAHHLAASIDEPDEGAAADIEKGATDALLRGAPEIGVELAARARELTPGDAEAARRRGLLHARCLQAAGDFERGLDVLAELVDLTPPGPARAEILFKLARTPRSFEEAVELCQRALDEAAGTRLAGEIAVVLATSLFVSGDAERGLAEAARAVELASAAGDELTTWRARAAVAMMQAARGGEWDLEILRSAADYELATLERPDSEGCALWFVQALHFNDLLDEARARGQDLRERAVQAGDAFSAAEFGYELTTIETRAGRLLDAYELALATLEEAEQIGWELGAGQQLELLALVEAWLGRADDARRTAERGHVITVAGGDRLGELRHSRVHIVLALGAQDWEEVARLTDEALAAQTATMSDPSVNPVYDFAVEAHAALGDVERATELTEVLEAALAEHPTARRRMEAQRCRGLVRAAEGELETAIASLAEAVSAAEELSAPHETGRTLLMLGRVQRRARHKADARASLERSIELFDEAGVRLFAEQARRELARVGGRAPGGDALTVTERRLAELVAEGRSNKEAAAALFVTVKTVEANLSRIYRKLGIRSRTELAASLLADGRATSKP